MIKIALSQVWSFKHREAACCRRLSEATRPIQACHPVNTQHVSGGVLFRLSFLRMSLKLDKRMKTRGSQTAVASAKTAEIIFWLKIEWPSPPWRENEIHLVKETKVTGSRWFHFSKSPAAFGLWVRDPTCGEGMKKAASSLAFYRRHAQRREALCQLACLSYDPATQGTEWSSCLCFRWQEQAIGLHSLPTAIWKPSVRRPWNGVSSYCTRARFLSLVPNVLLIRTKHSAFIIEHGYCRTLGPQVAFNPRHLV